jgi:hypothetical protein
MLEADADELHEVLGLEPDRQPPVIEMGIAEVADAQEGDAQPVLVGIGEPIASPNALLTP